MSRVVIFDLDDTLIHEGFEDHSFNNIICKETVNVLNYLKQNNFILAIASHNENADNILKKNKLDHYFDIIVGIDLSDSKTKIPLIEQILNHTNVDKENVYYFDDLQYYVDEICEYGITNSHLVDHIVGITMEDILTHKTLNF